MEITSQSATKIAELMSTRAVSPREVVEAHLARIEEVNPQLNAIVTIADDLWDQAKEAEAAIMRGDPLGPLHGLPLTVKDTIETAGLRSTSGSAIRSEFVPEKDATSVARLKSAGAIILGKTNAAEMAMDYNADNPVFGKTNHPLDHSLTPGGSSGGEAVAIYTGMSPAGLGTDLAGSIRIPAHFCGIAGLKPTVGQVPSDGQFPPSTGPYSLGAVIGPMARKVEDLRLLFNVLARPTGAGNKKETLRGCRVAWYSDDGVAPVTEKTREAVKRATLALTDAGLIAEERLPPGVERGHDLWLKIFSRASVVQLRKVYAGNEDKGGNFVRWRLSTADDVPAPTLDHYIQSWMERDRLRAELLDWMEQTPLILAPVGATSAYKHDTLKVTVAGQTFGTFRAFSYAQSFNVFDLPVVVVPAGLSAEGLPVGVQLIGRPFEEEFVLTAATIIEEGLRG